MSYFSSYGLSGYLAFKPQLSGIGGQVYSSVPSSYATSQGLSTAYAVFSGTSMATPYISGYVETQHIR